ncbi:MarR family winged helix-turn-helix transcriptional regulator [Paenibacillus xylaniclasticus]|uniref:MarR family winged helix-turn-helix transcriptional regulator n=1 Tax=Paenibacillus xylaniclasticus TaxID=588083 RepID=UPI001751500F|nr:MULTISPECIES: MarR family transcriptional regulator [Paenibacillus]GFN32808.1 transcriptional regulator [Paenibacillus curdlanolyticus]
MTDYPVQLKLEHQLCFALYACSREMTRLYRPFLDELGLTYTQYVTLLVLWEHDNVSVKQLGEELLLDSGTLTPLLKKLEAAGLITRTRDVKDERSVLVELTEQGRALRDRATDIPEKVFCQTGLSMEEGNGLREKLQQLVREMQET